MKILVLYLCSLLAPLCVCARDFPDVSSKEMSPFDIPPPHYQYSGDSIVPSVATIDTSPVKLGVSTNGLLWATTVMNLGGELFFHPHMSATLSVGWCPWFITEKFALRSLSILPEARWWLSTGHTGHFLGLHFSVAWYNVKFGDFRYQDTNQPLLGGGVTYGYYFPLKSNWGIELSIGAGYAYLRYDRFHNVDNGALADTRKTSWFGIDRAAISVSYRFSL